MTDRRIARPRPTAFSVSFGSDAVSGDDTSVALSQRPQLVPAQPAASVSSAKRKDPPSRLADLAHPRPGSKLRSEWPKRGPPPPKHVCNIAGTEVREGEAPVPGEDPEERLDTVDNKPVRILNNFAIFDPSHGFEYVPLNRLDGSEKADIEAVGYVSPAFVNEEDADQDDDDDDDPPDAHPRWRTTGIFGYSIDYTRFNEPLYVQTKHAWYILKSPDIAYAATYVDFYRPHRIAQIVVSAAVKREITTYSQFQEQYLDTWDDLLGARIQTGDLCEAAPVIKSIFGNDTALESQAFVQEIYTLAEQECSPYLKRPLLGSSGIKDHNLPRPKLKEGLMLGNLDVAVLRPENQNPTHVTPLIDKLAYGLFHEQLYVVGPPAQRHSRHDLKKRQAEVRSRVCQLLYRNVENRPPVSFPPDARLRDEYWKAVSIRGETYQIGDCIVVPRGNWNGVEGGELPQELSISEVPEDATPPDYFWFGKIVYIDQRKKRLHVQWFEHSSKTYLGTISDPHELFLCPLCGNIDLTVIPVLSKCIVHSGRPSGQLGPLEFFCQFMYNQSNGSFTDADTGSDIDGLSPPDNCPACVAFAQHNQDNDPVLTRDSLAYLGHTYHANDYALIRGTDGPAKVGQVISFHDKRGSNPTVSVRWLGRMVDLPANVAESSLPQLLHERELYMTNAEPVVVDCKDLLKRCIVLHRKSVPDMGLEEWLDLSPLHFYVRYILPSSDPPLWSARAKLERRNVHVCTRCHQDHTATLELHEALKKERPLRAFDPFAGCGAFGLSMEETGHMKVTHAVEISPSAADTLKKNSPSTVVYNQCANIVLKYAIKTHAGNNDEIPQHIRSELPLPPPPAPGEIDCIIAGFPCQSHSTLNMYQQAHDRKSHLMLTLLSWVDFLRPKYCFFENVKGFLNYNLHATQASRYRVEGGIDKGGLKFLVHALVAMGYQVRFGLLNAGHYGTPQGRIRFFLIAAVRGCPLPNLPEPSHASLTNEALAIHLGHKIDITPLRPAKGTAPMKHVSIQDAIGDLLQFDWELPEDIKNKLSKERKALLVRKSDRLAVPCHPTKARCGPEDIGITDMYISGPRTAFQERCRRRPVSELQHFTRMFNERVCVIYTVLVRVCLDHWPAGLFRDYRDLPVTEQDWALINPQSAGSRLGFPPGYYGRLDKNGWFRTISTNLQPMARQCQVTHYECCRIYTVREFARSQGFPDWFVFVANDGVVKTMHRQIGNAVPWQIGEALGRELRGAQLKTLSRSRRRVADVVEID